MGKAPWCMFLRTRRYHLGSSGEISIAHASRKPTLPCWQRWGKLRGISRNATLPSWQQWRKLDRACFYLGSDGRGGMTAACSKNAKNCGITGGSEGRSCIADTKHETIEPSLSATAPHMHGPCTVRRRCKRPKTLYASTPNEAHSGPRPARSALDCL